MATPISINFDIVQVSTVGYNFFAHDLEVTLEHNFFIYSRDESAVASTLDGNALINNGSMFSNAVDAAAVEVWSTNVTNNGLIRGWYDGIYSRFEDVVIINDGEIAGNNRYGVYFDFSTSIRTQLTNRGTIFGAQAGVLTDFGTIDNFGKIISNQSGIAVLADDNVGATVNINNKAGGLISGADQSLTVIFGRLILKNAGTMTGDISGGNAVDLLTGRADEIRNSGVINGIVELQQGNDIFNGRGGKSGAVFGQSGDDRLIGGNARDILDGGDGKDTLTGLGGRDKFVFANRFDSEVGARRDFVTDFKHAQHDKIDLHLIDANINAANNQAFKFIGTAGFHDRAGELRISHQGANVIVSGDVDGNGTADFQIGVHAANLVKGDFIL